MKQCNYEIHNIQSLKKYLNSLEIRKNIEISKSILIQVFISQEYYNTIENLVNIIKNLVPKATIVGSTTHGQISSGKTVNEKTVLAISFFEDTDIKVFSLACSQGKEKEVGNELIDNIINNCKDISGVLFLATPNNIEASKVLMGMEEKMESFPIFGGGAIAECGLINAFVFNGLDIINKGIVAVVFCSKSLRIKAYTYTGWEALSKEMKITEVENSLTVKKIDGKSAFSVYKKYLGIKNDENFELNVMEFPFLIERNGYIIARLPIASYDDGSIHFVADIKEGESVKLSYGNPESIIKNSRKIQRKILKFSPESIFLYSCTCRKMFMKQDIQLETEPFNKIAPTSGFYTYGEFYGYGKNLNLLNATMVVVGMSEDKEDRINISEVEDKLETNNSGVKSLVSRLGHFIKIVAMELEEANRELQELSYIDSLTKVYNHGKIEQIFIEEIIKAKEELNDLSVMLIDIDNFKEINDRFGHYIGDQILEEFSKVLKNTIRDIGFVGRWGGEEFFVVLTNTQKEDAIKISERIRKKIENKKFLKVENVTASFGVTSINRYEDSVVVFKRVDEALYEAKRSGKNKVVYK